MKTKVRIIKGLLKGCRYAKKRKKFPMCIFYMVEKTEDFLVRGWQLEQEASSNRSGT